jgi:hypothetical protein
MPFFRPWTLYVIGLHSITKGEGSLRFVVSMISKPVDSVSSGIYVLHYYPQPTRQAS